MQRVTVQVAGTDAGPGAPNPPPRPLRAFWVRLLLGFGDPSGTEITSQHTPNVLISKPPQTCALRRQTGTAGRK